MVRGAAELRVKESDRLGVMAAGLRTLGLQVDETPDGATIYPGLLHGGQIASQHDHRIAMAVSYTHLDVYKRQDEVRVLGSYPVAIA